MFITFFCLPSDNIPKLQMIQLVILDALIGAWHHKPVFDHVRPFTAIRVAFGEDILTPASAHAGPAVVSPSEPELIEAWAGPGKARSFLSKPRNGHPCYEGARLAFLPAH